jgi:hypothetical protein
MAIGSRARKTVVALKIGQSGIVILRLGRRVGGDGVASTIGPQESVGNDAPHTIAGNAKVGWL